MLSDEMVIIAYTKEEVKNLNKNNDIKLLRKNVFVLKQPTHVLVIVVINSNKQKFHLIQLL